MQIKELLSEINSTTVNDWQDISGFLDKVVAAGPEFSRSSKAEFEADLKRGIAFITYDYGIDGVSIEVFKYASCLEKMLSESKANRIPMHFIGGEFYEKADVVLKDRWHRFRIPEMDGWNKWYDGKYFAKLYYEDMLEGSEVSREMAREMWRQAADFAGQLGPYLENNRIKLLIPVNIPSNPGNFAIMLAIILVTEALGTCVLSSNHDYYWEGGKPASEREPGEAPGVRDHFFRNCANKSFFGLFQRMYPWNGQRWIQVNINSPQTETLIDRFGFDPEKVFELGTSISDSFFRESEPAYVKSVRERMGYIISDGKGIIEPVDVKQHIANLGAWIQDQKPLACAHRAGLKLDLTRDKTLFCLQPTRVIERKRIEMDLQMLQALLHYPPFRDEFANNEEYQLVHHITGPTPIEHQEDLENVLRAFIDLCASVPDSVADRIFIEFSVGNEYHPCFEQHGFKALRIEDIYQLATVVLFPSETEGRGLPIIESSAGGIPIICSRYYPETVFEEVVGEHLSDDEEHIRYIEFPEDGYRDKFLAKTTEILLHPEHFENMKIHNRRAVHLRYSSETIRHKFEIFLEELRKLS